MLKVSVGGGEEIVVLVTSVYRWVNQGFERRYDPWGTKRKTGYEIRQKWILSTSAISAG